MIPLLQLRGKQVMKMNLILETLKLVKISIQRQRKGNGTYEELLFSQRTNEPGNHPQATASDHSTESLIIRSQKEGDWFISNQQDKPTNRDENMNLRTFDGDDASSIADDHFLFEESKKDAANIVEATQNENATSEIAHDKAETNGTHEPEDLYMVLGRDSAAENATSSWTPEMDYENDLLSAEANGRHSGVETIAAGDKLPSNDKGTNGKPGGNARGKAVKADAPQKKGRKEAMSEDPKEVPATSNINEFKDVKELHSIAPVDKNEGNVISKRDTFDDKGSNGSLSHINSSAQLDHIKGNDVGLSMAAPILSENIKTSGDHDQYTSEMTKHPAPKFPNKDINHSDENIRENGGRIENLPSPQKSEIQYQPHHLLK
ncbi:hypothetical protein GH714_025219 [Hevea brasiliensis]|uniref:Uncharacterized protein n=1 Tax=Hevea brasiliensis TaxID=3981 RepID=A0A6A6MM20_HEVBR|nr:hypothetical protein GH714_025219 [Hevea brasiliensis]